MKNQEVLDKESIQATAIKGLAQDTIDLAKKAIANGSKDEETFIVIAPIRNSTITRKTDQRVIQAVITEILSKARTEGMICKGLGGSAFLFSRS
jgi:hypothetical protein